MKIYFQNITFQGSPLVWELNESTHQATCLLYCIKKEANSRFEPKIDFEMFKGFPGVTIDDGKIFIKDVRTFNEAYQSLEHLDELKEKIQSRTAMLRKQSTFFQHGKDQALQGATSSNTRRRSASAATLPLYSHIILDELIKNDQTNSSLWGDTVSYESYFEKKTSNDAKAREAIFLKSIPSFYIMVQYEKNQHLYPLKSKLIKEIRKLLDELDPIYMTWCTQEMTYTSRESVFHYFQDAVLEAMLNGTFNNKATEFEAPELEKLNPALREYAIEKARALRAELMLMKFNILINPELPSELALNKKEAKKTQPEITSFRKFMLKQPIEAIEEIKQKLKKMADLIIQSGIVEESSLKLSTQLNHELSSKAPVIMGFHSFQALLHIQLDKQLTSNKKELIPDITTKVAKETIIQINQTFGTSHSQYIAPLSKVVDSDFYLCKEGAEQLAVELAEIKLKHPKDEKKVLAYGHAIADKVVSFLQHQLHEYIPTQEQPEASRMSM
ncbi:hypothetical protein [Legionella steigerwaltii]|nr:hypothetical protein [Legionella steigerwaltii]